MKRTILSSFLFLYPVNLSFKNKDPIFLNMSTLALAISAINHSHNHISNSKISRKYIFKKIDQYYMIFLCIYHTFRCLLYSYRNNKNNLKECIKDIFKNYSIVFFIYFYILKGHKKDFEMEEYEEYQKNAHVLFHVFSIILIGLTYKKYIMNNEY